MKTTLTALIFILSALLYPAHLIAQWSTSPISFQGEERDGAFTFVINGTAYIGGGILLNDMWKFNEGTQQFTQLNQVANGFKRSFAASFAAGGFGYVVGGDSAFGAALNEVWKYNPATDSWTRLSDFPGGKRVGMAAWSSNNRVFVAGGTDVFSGSGYGTFYKDCYEYFPATDTWTKLGDLPIGVVFPTFFSHGNKIYFVHGATSNSTYNNDVYEMDIQQLTWNKTVTFPGTARNAGIGFSMGNYIYIGLGQSGFSSSFKDFYLFSPTNNSWIILQNYPSPISGWSAAFVLNNKAYIGTGLDVETFDFSKSFYTYTGFNTGLHQIQPSGFHIEVFPNPASGSIHCKALGSGSMYRITDLLGRVMQKGYSGKEGEVHISDLVSGTYFIFSETGSGKFVKE